MTLNSNFTTGNKRYSPLRSLNMKNYCERELNLDFWKHVTPYIVPFTEPCFGPSERELKTNDVKTTLQCKFSNIDSSGRVKSEDALYKGKNEGFSEKHFKPSQLQIPKTVRDNNFNIYHLKNLSLILEDMEFVKPKSEDSEFSKSNICAPSKSTSLYPEIKLHRIEDSVDFLRHFKLRPTWKNGNLFQSPFKSKKLSKFRRRRQRKNV